MASPPRTVLCLSLPFFFASAGCSDDETTAAPMTCQDYASVTAGGSFKDDVMPLFSRACALSASCHQGDAGQGIEGLGLGPSTSMGAPDQATIDGIHAQLLGQAPGASPLPFVKPNDPVGSWLMAKIEYNTADLAVCSECTGECGDFMPQNPNPTPTSGYTRAERDTIAAWILDGAQNN